jgi:pentatricopeptide repeat protein
MDDMFKSGMHVNVHAKTALLKGYAHAGRIRKGAELFDEMCRSKGKQ